jgi:hypothetical protein
MHVCVCISVYCLMVNGMYYAYSDMLEHIRKLQKGFLGEIAPTVYDCTSKTCKLYSQKTPT